jgi:hypothetical protein
VTTCNIGPDNEVPHSGFSKAGSNMEAEAGLVSDEVLKKKNHDLGILVLVHRDVKNGEMRTTVKRFKSINDTRVQRYLLDQSMATLQYNGGGLERSSPFSIGR